MRMKQTFMDTKAARYGGSLTIRFSLVAGVSAVRGWLRVVVIVNAVLL